LDELKKGDSNIVPIKPDVAAGCFGGKQLIVYVAISKESQHI
jgi:hypothetical protein